MNDARIHHAKDVHSLVKCSWSYPKISYSLFTTSQPDQ